MTPHPGTLLFGCLRAAPDTPGVGAGDSRSEQVRLLGDCPVPWALALHPNGVDTSVPSAHQALWTRVQLLFCLMHYLTTQCPIAVENLELFPIWRVRQPSSNTIASHNFAIK